MNEDIKKEVECVSIADAFKFVCKDDLRMISKINDLNTNNIHYKKFTLCLSTSRDDFKKQYVQYQTELLQWKFRLEFEYKTEFFLINLKSILNQDNDCSIMGVTINIEAAMSDKRKAIK